MKKYLIPISAILLTAVVIAAAIWPVRAEQVTTQSPGGMPHDKAAPVGLFIVDGEIFYINSNGQLIRYDNDEIVHTFPNHAVQYSDGTDKFVYADGEKLCTYDMKTDAVDTIASNGAQYVSYADADFVFYTRDYVEYVWNVKKQTEIELDSDWYNVFGVYDNYILHTRDGYRFCLTDFDTSDYILLEKDRFETHSINDACLVGDMIYYNRQTDNTLKCLSVQDGTIERLTDVRDDVLEMEAAGDEVLMVTGKYVDNIYLTAIGKLDKNGNYIQLTEYAEPSPITAAACELVTDGNIYAYAVAGQNQIVTGKLS